MFVEFPFGTEVRLSQQNHEGGWPGFGMVTVGIHPNDFDLNPNKIPTGGVVQNCHISLHKISAVPVEVGSTLPNSNIPLESCKVEHSSS